MEEDIRSQLRTRLTRYSFLAVMVEAAVEEAVQGNPGAVATEVDTYFLSNIKVATTH